MREHHSRILREQMLRHVPHLHRSDAYRHRHSDEVIVKCRHTRERPRGRRPCPHPPTKHLILQRSMIDTP